MNTRNTDTLSTTAGYEKSTSPPEVSNTAQKSVKRVLPARKNEAQKKYPTLRIIKQNKQQNKKLFVADLYSEGTTLTLKEPVQIYTQRESFESLNPEAYFSKLDLEKPQLQSLGIVFISLALVTIAKFLYNINLGELLNSFISVRKGLTNRTKNLPQQMRIVSQIAYYLNIAAFAALGVSYFSYSTTPYLLLFGKSLLFVFLYELSVRGINLSFYYLSGKTIKAEQINLTRFNYKCAEGLFLIPVLVLIPISESIQKQLLIIGISLLVVLELRRIFESSLSLLQHKLSLRHNLIYIATLEVAPTLIIIKLIS